MTLNQKIDKIKKLGNFEVNLRKDAFNNDNIFLTYKPDIRVDNIILRFIPKWNLWVAYEDSLINESVGVQKQVYKILDILNSKF